MITLSQLLVDCKKQLLRNYTDNLENFNDIDSYFFDCGSEMILKIVEHSLPVDEKYLKPLFLKNRKLVQSIWEHLENKDKISDYEDIRDCLFIYLEDILKTYLLAISVFDTEVKS